MSFVTVLSRGTWLNLRRVRAYPRIFLLVSALVGFAWVFGLHEKMRPGEGVILTDFVNVYAAGLAVREGHPAEVYDWRGQKNREDRLAQDLGKGKKKQDDSSIPWLYPPPFLGIAWLAALMPYFAALGTYLVVGFVAFALSLRKLAPPYEESLWALAAFPGVFINGFSGQNGFITSAFLAAGLFLLDESPLAAGIALGVLSYKPHLFVLIPLALLAGRYWKTLGATLVSAGLFGALSVAAFGFESWQAFVSGLSATTDLLKIDNGRWLGSLHSVFSMVRELGGGIQTAYALQTVVAGCAVLVVLWIWRRPSASLAVRGASLATAALLASPYSFAYDQVLLAIPIALLARHGLESGFRPFEKTFLFALWLLPFLVIDGGKHFALPLTPPMLIMLIALCWRRAKMEVRGTAHREVLG
jgi:hypothetical protein